MSESFGARLDALEKRVDALEIRNSINDEVDELLRPKTKHMRVPPKPGRKSDDGCMCGPVCLCEEKA